MTTQRDVPIMTTAPTQNAVPVSTSKTEVPKKVVKRVLMTRTQYAAMKEGRQVVSLVGAGTCENSQPGRVVLQQGQPIQTMTNAQNRVHLQGTNAVRRCPNNRTVIAVNTGNQPGVKPASTRTVIHAEGDVLGGCVEQTTVSALCLVYHILLHLRPWLVPTSGVAGIAVYLLPPFCPVCYIVLFQPHLCHIALNHIFPP